MLKPSSYGFRSDDTSILSLDSVGWQFITNPSYHFSGNNRPDCGHVIFQYTLGGQGYFEYEQVTYPLPRGTAFLAKVPGNHAYWYQQSAEPWEILWLNLRGAEATRIWDLLISQEGPVIRRDAQSPVIQNLWKLLSTIAEEKITDKYHLSLKAYEWLLTLVQSSKDMSHDMSASSSTIVQRAKAYMKTHYQAPVTLDMIADHCGVTKHYFCRLFQRTEHTTPLSYLRDRRMEAALSLLRTTDLPIHHVGQQCGFESPSYFGKIFRLYMSMTPKEYRLKKLEFPFDAIYYE